MSKEAMASAWRKRILVLTGLSVSIALSDPSLASGEIAKRFSIPFEISDGLIRTKTGPDLYTASVRLQPTFSLIKNRLGVGATLGTAYVNPGISALAGGRVVLEIGRFSMMHADLAAFRLVGEALWGTHDERLLGGAAELDFGADGVLLLTLRYARDLEHEFDLWQFGVGINLVTWFTGPDEDP